MEFEFKGKREKELTVAKGEIIGVTKDNLVGWSVGKYNGSIGLFPTSFASRVKFGETDAASVVLKVFRGYKFNKGLNTSKLIIFEL